MKIILRFVNEKTIGFLAVFILSIVIYYLTLAPTMFWIDAAIYLTTIKEFGIAYPPGFPLYIILAKIWSFFPLPGFNFTQKINFLSSIFQFATYPLQHAVQRGLITPSLFLPKELG